MDKAFHTVALTLYPFNQQISICCSSKYGHGNKPRTSLSSYPFFEPSSPISFLTVLQCTCNDGICLYVIADHGLLWIRDLFTPKSRYLCICWWLIFRVNWEGLKLPRRILLGMSVRMFPGLLRKDPLWLWVTSSLRLGFQTEERGDSELGMSIISLLPDCRKTGYLVHLM